MAHLLTICSLAGANGAYPCDGLIADAKGGLFGTTYGGGADGYGTVFEIANTGAFSHPIYASAPTTLVSFNGANGAYPVGGLIADAKDILRISAPYPTSASAT